MSSGNVAGVRYWRSDANSIADRKIQANRTRQLCPAVSGAGVQTEMNKIANTTMIMNYNFIFYYRIALR